MIRLSRYLKPYTWPILAALIMIVAQSVAQLYLPTQMARIVDEGVSRNNIPLIWRTGGFMLLVAMGGTLAALLSSYLAARISTGYGRDLRRRVFSHVETFSPQEFDKLSTASLIVRTTNDITQVQTVALMVMRMVVRAPITAVGGVLMAVSLDSQLSWLLAAVVPILALVVLTVGRIALPIFRSVQRKLDRLNLVLRENLAGIRVIRAFDRVEYEKRRFDGANRDLTGASLRVHRIVSVVMPAMMLILNLTSIAAIWIGGFRVDAGQLEVGALIAFIQYAMLILMSMMMMSMIFVMLPRAAASAERINEVLAVQPAITDPAEPVKPEAITGLIEFRDVTFTYPGASLPAVRDVSFVARPGEFTAIIGGTGSGKSTLINLIPRFYDVDQGAVLVDGVDVRQMAQAELRGRIGYVSQKAVLFSGAVADNIRYGDPGASEAGVREAAGVAQAEEFVTAMADGFESEIAQGGVNVSGGQKQRLAIARAVVRRPAVYIFDDCFSALDFRTDARLRAALRAAAADATVIVVAQRVASVMDADQILVLDEGRLVGTGTHAELVRANEVYREIVASQLPEEVVA